jgi:hypothetical protein
MAICLYGGGCWDFPICESGLLADFCYLFLHFCTSSLSLETMMYYDHNEGNRHPFLLALGHSLTYCFLRNLIYLTNIILWLIWFMDKHAVASS